MLSLGKYAYFVPRFFFLPAVVHCQLHIHLQAVANSASIQPDIAIYLLAVRHKIEEQCLPLSMLFVWLDVKLAGG